MKIPSSSLQILIGIVAGVLCGLFLGEEAYIFNPIAMAFIKIMQIAVIPFLVSSIISGISNLKRTDAKKIGFKGGIALICLWVISITVILFLVRSFPQIHTESFFSTRFIEEEKPFDYIELFVPYNVFHSLAEGYVPAIVLFCFIMGFCLMGDEKNRSIRDALFNMESIFLQITNYLKLVIPIGTFAIFAVSSGTLKLSDILEMQIFLVSVIIYGLLMTLLILPLILYSITPFGYREILSTISKPVLLSFSVGSAFIALPEIHQSVVDLSKKYSPEEKVKSYADFFIPLGYSIPLTDSFMATIFVLFAAWYYDNSSSIANQLGMMIISIPWLFGSSNLAVQSLLNLYHLPSDSIELFVSTRGIYINLNTTLQAMSLFSFSVISITLLTGLAKINWRRTMISLFIILFALSSLVIGLNLGFNGLLQIYQPQENVLSTMDLPINLKNSNPDDNLNVTVLSSLPQRENNVNINIFSAYAKVEPNVLKRIKNRNLLVVGYNASNLPFCFFNGKGDLVGYNVQMAYDLAKFLGISRIKFVPENHKNLSEDLNSGYCDIIMSRTWVTEKLLNEVDFTSPYIQVHMSFVVPDWKKDEFESFEDISSLKNLSIYVERDSGRLQLAQRIFPSAKIITINSYEDYFKYAKEEPLFISAETGYPLTLLHPSYDVAILKPADIYKSHYAYPIALNNETFLKILNYWIRSEDDYGGLNSKYDYWVLGKNTASQKSRWCIARDVLHLY